MGRWAAAVRRFVAFCVLPVVLLLAWFVTPLATGEKTLILRDILNTHLVDRISLGASLRQFELPLIDPLRAGGQALAGNLNALPFYPDNLLLLLGSGGQATLWALNAHFWLHWFLALAGAFWMGRAFGLSRPAAWMAATAYAFSGYFASQLNLYNTVAAAALAPALVAALLETAPGKSPAVRRRGLLFAGLLWALLLVGGEPVLALLALALAASALVVVAGRRAVSWRLAVALLAGTLLAAPQIIEMARILPLSFRNNAVFGEPQAIVGSFRWAHLADLFWPFFFGRPSLSEVLAPQQFDGYPPLLFTLYPGLLAMALALVGASGAFGARARVRRNRAVLWGIGTVAVALFLALGRFNPLVAWLWRLPWGRLLHFPAKFWLLGAVGGSLLCGLGFEAARRRDLEGASASGRRLLERLLGLLAVFFVLFLGAANLAPRVVSGLVAGLLSPSLPAATLGLDLVRLQGLALLSVGLLLLALGLLRLGRRAPVVGFGASGAGAAFIWLHAATQLWAILPAVPMDDVGPYLAPPPILAAIPTGSVVMHGGNHDLFRPGTMTQGKYPDSRILWHTRRAARELYPFSAMLHGLRAELAVSPEGLDSFLTQALTVGIKGFSDRRRLDLLEALGVDYLLLDRELASRSARESPRSRPRRELRPDTAALRARRPGTRGGVRHPCHRRAADERRPRGDLRPGLRSPSHRRRPGQRGDARDARRHRYRRERGFSGSRAADCERSRGGDRRGAGARRRGALSASCLPSSLAGGNRPSPRANDRRAGRPPRRRSPGGAPPRALLDRPPSARRWSRAGARRRRAARAGRRAAGTAEGAGAAGHLGRPATAEGQPGRGRVVAFAAPKPVLRMQRTPAGRAGETARSE